MTSIRKRVAEAAAEIIRTTPTGIRWADLHRAVAKKLNENSNTIHGSLYAFSRNLPEGFYKPDRGVYAFGDALVAEPVIAPPANKSREADYYQSFADWLVGDLEEATRAEPIGGNAAGGKWGTPDVIGLYEPRESDPVKFTKEVVAAEIKIDTNSLIVAFGQACAYKLFAHRVYIVVPRNANPNDLKRLDALAGVVGIGLVKFNADDPENPEFAVMVRAAKHEPDYFYTNEVLGHFKKQLGL
jgi:hypothetical protein